MSRIRYLALGTLLLTCTTPAASSQRTFVSPAGVDNTACSILAPCRTFAAAVAVTSPSGELIVLDSGGYGTIPTISQSISIIAAPGIHAGISVFSGNGINVTGSSVKVVFRGLTITGMGGNTGIEITAVGNAPPGSVHIENCVIANMQGSGIAITTGALYVSDTMIRNNGSSGVLAGDLDDPVTLVRVQAEGNAIGFDIGSTYADIQDSVASGNRFIGIRYSSVMAVGGVSITRTLIAHNEDGLVLQPFPGGAARAVVSDSTISDNAHFGVWIGNYYGPIAASTVAMLHNSIARNGTGVYLFTGSTGATVTLDGNLITQNEVGVVSESGTTVFTRGNNTIQGNVTDKSYAGTTTTVGGD